MLIPQDLLSNEQEVPRNHSTIDEKFPIKKVSITWIYNKLLFFLLLKIHVLGCASEASFCNYKLAEKFKHLVIFSCVSYNSTSKIMHHDTHQIIIISVLLSKSRRKYVKSFSSNGCTAELQNKQDKCSTKVLGIIPKLLVVFSRNLYHRPTKTNHIS